MPRPAILTLSEAGRHEVERVRDFMKRQHSSHLVMHTVERQEHAAEHGLLFKIEDEDGELVSTAMVIPIGRTGFHEMGNCSVARLWRGFKLQRAMILVRAATMAVLAGFSERLVTVVDPNNEPSLRNTTDLGFVPLPSTIQIAELFLPCSQCAKHDSLPPQRQCCSDFVFLPQDAHRALLRQFLRLGPEMAVSNKQDRRQAVLKLACKGARDPLYRRILRDVATEESRRK
jgi:hypothetical protein